MRDENVIYMKRKSFNLKTCNFTDKKYNNQTRLLNENVWFF